MQDLEFGPFSLEIIGDRLSQGLDLFGPYADWIWAMAVAWAIIAISLLLHSARQQRRSDRAYLAYASRNLPVLRRIARQRAQEVAFSRRTDRF